MNYLINLIYIILSVVVCPTRQSPTDIQTCTQKTLKCPLTKRQWEERTRQYNCSLEDLDYTCIHTTKGGLVEACMNPHFVETYEGKCPTVIACDDRIYPVLAIEKDYINCPDNVKGCPTKNGPRYTVHELYRCKCVICDDDDSHSITIRNVTDHSGKKDLILFYPACLVLNRSELLSTPRSTLSTHACRESSSYIQPETSLTVSTDSTTLSTTSRQSSTRIQPETSVTVSTDVNTTRNTTLVTPGDPILSILPPTLLIALFVVGFITTISFIAALVKLFNRHKDHQTDVENIDFVDYEDVYLGLKIKLREMNKKKTEKIPVLPLQKSAKKLPIEEIFASVVIKQDSRYNGMMGTATHDEDKMKDNPKDLFYDNDLPVSRIFMLGEAAHGKTLYCLWLLHKWLKNDQSDGERDEWNEALGRFDFVFMIQLRDMDKSSSSSVIDIVCKEFDEDAVKVRELLTSRRYRCLILLDGLNDWEEKGLPGDDGIMNAVVFYTMRPWRLYEIDEDVLQRNDVRVIEILGLDSNGSKTLVEKVLTNSVCLKKGDEKYEEILTKSEDESVRAFMKIPLLVCVCVWLWHSGEQLPDNLAYLYASLVDLMINRAEIDPKRIQSLRNDTSGMSCFRKEFQEHFENKTMYQFMSIFSKIGKIAFENICGKTKLDFQKGSFGRVLGEKGDKFERFLLDVGLISHKEGISITSRNVRLGFLTKSVQEFLAAIYVVVDGSKTLFENLTSFHTVKKLANVINFICGMSQCLGSEISHHIANIPDIVDYRRLPLRYPYTFGILYKFQSSWFKEIRYGDQSMDNSNIFGDFHIYIDESSDSTIVDFTSNLLEHYSEGISFLHLCDPIPLPYKKQSFINDISLKKFLGENKYLDSLQISSFSRIFGKISIPSLKSLQLSHTRIDSSPLLEGMPLLEYLGLGKINVWNKDIGLTSDMKHIKLIELYKVALNSDGWRKFVESLKSIEHEFSIVISGTEMGEEIKTLLCSPPDFTVLESDHLSSFTTRPLLSTFLDGKCEYFIRRVWPPRHDPYSLVPLF